MTIDISWIGEGIPIYAFLLIFGVIYAIIAKTKILGESTSINAFISLIFSVIFISFSTVQEYLVNITVWFTVLLISAFFFLLVIVFIVKEPGPFLKPLGIIFVILLALVVVISIFYTFPGTQAYLPGESESGANDFLLSIKHFFLEERTLSGILLIIVAVIAIFVVTR